MKTQKSKKEEENSFSIFDRVSAKVSRAAGSAYAFLTAFSLIIIWLISGPFFEFSDTWQLIINTSTTIITFLMVFIIQQSQNKDTTAIQLKLNELIACNEKANNRLIDIEDLSERELHLVKEFYINLSKIAAEESDLRATHSLDEAIENQASKSSRLKKPRAATKKS